MIEILLCHEGRNYWTAHPVTPMKHSTVVLNTVLRTGHTITFGYWDTGTCYGLFEEYDRKYIIFCFRKNPNINHMLK